MTVVFSRFKASKNHFTRSALKGLIPGLQLFSGGKYMYLNRCITLAYCRHFSLYNLVADERLATYNYVFQQYSVKTKYNWVKSVIYVKIHVKVILCAKLVVNVTGRMLDLGCLFLISFMTYRKFLWTAVTVFMFWSHNFTVVKVVLRNPAMCGLLSII